MILGPVFHAELLTTARRPRYYAIRAIYGSMILFQVYLVYRFNRARWDGAEVPIRELAEFGHQFFSTFAVVQAVVVGLLTPALVGGTIAEERQRKTLHYLLTSRLGSLEIVGGKLTARLLLVGVLVALGLPVVSLIGLFGGVDFLDLVLSYAGTLTLAYFLAGVSILVSVQARRPREAITVLYAFLPVWLVVPPVVFWTMPYWPAPWPAIYQWAEPVLRMVAITSPIFLLDPSVRSWFGGLASAAIWEMGCQAIGGTAAVLVAAARLRPASRGEGAGRGLGARLAAIGRRRWFPRPACGDDAMLWKERYAARTGGLTRLALTVVALGLLGFLGYFLWEVSRPAAIEMVRDGYFAFGSARRNLNEYLRFVCTAAFCVWSLGVASGSAGALTSEREEDTWISLVSTPLSGSEILRAKLIGPAWGLRWLAGLMVGLWGIGLALGAVHPLGVLACAIEMAVFTAFLSAMGLAYSLRSRTSTRALAATIGTLVFLNGGYLFCCIPLEPDTAMIGASATPFLFAASLMSVEDFREFANRSGRELAAACVLGVLVYGVAAAGLIAWLFQSFDEAVDRPDRSASLTPFQQKARRDRDKPGGAPKSF